MDVNSDGKKEIYGAYGESQIGCNTLLSGTKYSKLGTTAIGGFTLVRFYNPSANPPDIIFVCNNAIAYSFVLNQNVPANPNTSC